MATFAERWVEAKKHFEVATNKKKPRESFKQKVFGTGVASAFKELDKKKTAKEVVEQVGKVKIACSTYIKTLLKATENPEDVDEDAKPLYVTEIKKLQKKLEELQEEALQVESILQEEDKTDKKTKITAKGTLQLKAFLEHVKLRESMVEQVKQWVKEGETTIKQLAELAVAIKQDLGSLDKATREQDVSAIPLLLQRIRENVRTATERKREFEDLHKQRTVEGSPLMKARGDGPVRDEVPPEVLEPLQQRSNKAFSTYNPQSTTYSLSHPKQVGELIVKIQRYEDEADKLAGNVKPAREYLNKFQPVVLTLDKLINESNINLLKYQRQVDTWADNLKERAEQILKVKESEQEAQIQLVVNNTFKNMVKANVSVLESAQNRVKLLKQLGKQIATIPDGARSDDAVDQLVNTLNEKLREATDKTQQAVTLIEQSNVNYNNGETALRQKIQELKK